MEVSVQQESTDTAPKAEQVYFPYTTTPMPELIAAPAREVGSRWHRLSIYLTGHLPTWILNNSSNVVGGIQMIAEMMQFKSGGFDLISKENKGKPLLYIPDAFNNVRKAALGKFKNTGRPFEFTKPSAYVEAVRGFVDLKRASHIDSVGGTVQLTNNLSALSGLTGMCSMALATLLPDRKESAEETEQMATMAHDKPLGYVGMRLGQAVNPISWWDNKRQISGLGMMVTGIASFLSGFRQVEGNVVGKQIYRRNIWHMVGGLITATAGTQLMLAINNQQGWTNYGTTQLGRIVTLGPSIYSRFQKGQMGWEQGAGWYLGSQAMMVTKNATASLIGGTDLHNGIKVDHRAMREQARDKIKQEETKQQPTNEVTSVQAVSKALPEQDAVSIV